MFKVSKPATRPMRSTLAATGLTVLAAAALAACQPALPEAQAAASPATEPPVVPVALAVYGPIDQGAHQLGRVESAQRVELQARVSGPIDAVLFTEGSLVRTGQPLLQIDPRPFDAAVARARAELQLTRAQESLAASEVERARKLHVDRAIASEALDRRQAALAEAMARRAAAEAALQTAQLDRDFSLVRAPIAGRIGRALVTAGNFVAAGTNATALTSIVSIAPLHVHFDVSDRLVLDRLTLDKGAKHWKARILDADDGHELAEAPIDFAHHSMDAETGTLRLRARVDTPHPRLMPGQFVRVQLRTGQAEPALTVPDKAVSIDQGQRFVLVVGAEGQVEYRSVRVSGAIDQQRIVTWGLKAGEQVVVSGLMRVRPGMTVKPQLSIEPARAAASTSNHF